MQFGRVELPTLRHHMVYPRLSHPSYKPEKNKISFKFNYIQALKWGKKSLKVYKWIFQIVIAKCASITCIFNQLHFQSIYFIVLLIRIFFLYSNACKTKQAVKFFSQILFFDISSKKLKWQQYFCTDASTFECGC